MICSPPFRGVPSFRRSDASVVVGEQITSPAAEYPITVAQAKKQIEIAAGDASHDEHLQRLIVGVTKFLQDQTGRQFVRSTITFGYDRFPHAREVLWVPRPPLVTVNSIQYLDLLGATQTMPTADYLVATDRQPGRISLKRLGAGFWPATLAQGRAVTISADCGYATAADVPEDAKLCLLWLTNEWFENRGGGEEYGGQLKALIESLRLGDDFLTYCPVPGDPANIGYGNAGPGDPSWPYYGF